MYLSTELSGSLLQRVMIHELGHCVIFSYGLTGWFDSIEAEETACNLIADYGMEILEIYGDIFTVPYELDRSFQIKGRMM